MHGTHARFAPDCTKLHLSPSSSFFRTDNIFPTKKTRENMFAVHEEQINLPWWDDDRSDVRTRITRAGPRLVHPFAACAKHRGATSRCEMQGGRFHHPLRFFFFGQFRKASRASRKNPKRCVSASSSVLSLSLSPCAGGRRMARPLLY